MTELVSTITVAFITRMGAGAAKKAWHWMMTEGWARSFAKTIRKMSRTKVPVRRIEAWLSLPETKESLAAPSESRLTDSFERLIAALKPRIVIRAERYEPEKIRALALPIFETALDQFLLSLTLAEEIKTVHERESEQLDELKQLIKPNVPEDIGQLGLPPNMTTWLRRAREEAPDETNRVIAAFRDAPGLPDVVFRDLLEPVVPWLSPGSPALLVALALGAESLKLERLALNAYLAAAENGASDRSRWIGSAAMILQQDRDDPLFEQLLTQLQTEDSLSPVPQAMVAYLVGEPAPILDIDFSGLESPDDRALMHRFRAHVHEVAGDADRALEELEAGVQIATSPGSLALHFAHSLLHRAINAGGVAATNDKRRAIRFALTVRDQRRAWKGPSAEAAKIAVQALLSLQEAVTALKYAVGPPYGEATETEAANPDLIKLGAQAALAIEHEEALASLLPQLEGFERKWIEAERARRREDLVETKRLLEEALPLADDPADMWAVQQAMADAGVWPIPGLDELERTNPFQAALVRAQSEARRGDGKAAERTIRPFLSQSPGAAYLLAEIQHEEGDLESAGRTLAEAHERFNRPDMLVGAALMFEGAHRYDDARSAAERAVGYLPSRSSKGRAARSLLMRLAAKRNDMRSLALEAQSLIDDGDQDPGVKWTLAQAFARRFRFEEAWQVVRGLEPPDHSSEQDVHLWLTLGARFADDEDFVSCALDLVDASGTEEIRGHGLLAVLSITNRVSVSDEIGKRAHDLIEKFLTDFPSTQIITRMTFNNIDELFEKLTPQLSSGADKYQELVEKVSEGQAPFGLLAAFAGKAYGEALVRRAAGCLPIIKPFADELTQEMDAIRFCLDGKVVVEPSAIHTMSLLPEFWSVVRSLFKQISLPEPSRADLVMARGQLEMRSTMSMGWDARTNQAIISEIEEEQLDTLIERAGWMDEQSKDLDLVSLSQMEHFTNLDEDAFRPWIAPVDLAVSSGTVLYSDDPTLRVIARDAGALAFGTGALLNYLFSEGIIVAEQRTEIRSTLLANYVVDLVPSIVELDELATREEWSLGAAAFNVSRRLFWAGREDASLAWEYLIKSAKEHNPQALAGWLMVATIGLLKSVESDQVEAAARLLARTSLLLGGNPDDFLLELHGTRRGLVEAGVEGDPLRHFVVLLLEEETLGGIDARARYVTGLLSSLVAEDHEKAMRFVLGLD